MRITLLIPTKNEADGLRAILPRLQAVRHCVDEIIFIDQDSTDGTRRLIMDAGFRLHCQVSKGLTESILEGASLTKADFIIEFSPDGNCKPEDLPEVAWRLIDGYECVVVSRYWQSIRSADNTLFEALGSRLFTLLIGGLGHTPITDAMNIYRAYPRRWLADPDFCRFLRGPVLEPLTSAWALKTGARYVEVRSSEPPRIGGTSKMRWWYNGTLVLWMIVKVFLFRHKTTK